MHTATNNGFLNAVKRAVSKIAEDPEHQEFVELFRQRDSGKLSPEKETQLDRLYSKTDQKVMFQGARFLFVVARGGKEAELGAHLFIEQVQEQMLEYFTWEMMREASKQNISCLT